MPKAKLKAKPKPRRRMNPRSLANLKQRRQRPPSVQHPAPEVPNPPSPESLGSTPDPIEESIGRVSASIEEKSEAFDSVAVPETIGPTAGPAASPDPNPEVPDGAELLASDISEHGIPELDEDTVKYYLQTGFTLAGDHFDPCMYLSMKELNTAAKFGTPVARKWLPLLLKNNAYKEEIAFCIVMFGLLGPRFLYLKRKRSQAGTSTQETSASQTAEKAT